MLSDLESVLPTRARDEGDRGAPRYDNAGGAAHLDAARCARIVAAGRRASPPVAGLRPAGRLPGFDPLIDACRDQGTLSCPAEA
jgi:hypothetical protein